MKSQIIIIPAAINNNNYDGICEAVNCCKRATIIIEVSAGPNGETISLSVCDNCVKKFRQEVYTTGTAILPR
jgi:hypothetical protein